MELVVYIDFASAPARLALTPTRRLVEEAGIAPDWRPLLGKTRRHPSDPRSRGASHARVRAQYRRREEAFYAKHQGILLDYPDAGSGSFAACAGLAWLRLRHGPLSRPVDAYVERMFEQVWSGTVDPGGRAAALAAVVAAGGDGTGFDSWFEAQAETDLEDYRRQALEQGVVDVPGYVVGGEPFVGRANLPVIRRLLADGRAAAGRSPTAFRVPVAATGNRSGGDA